MSRPAVADFVDSFFTRTLFQADDILAASVLATELAADANININGTPLTSSEFVTLITTQFRSAFTAAIVKIKDLNIVTRNDSGSTGVVGQWTAYVTKGKEDGKELKQSATTIVKVEERDGKPIVTGIWEAQTVDDA
ncbi:hypothetical protein P152DRAFT_456674 [Eremomyces bilateralis CBS 781.70]|uniref:SnoaL-like domain-containing protein n=1 Tax=Eremomyces bilateralis CBS 781.70 TaxID=1392243 RepID=A0A6G1G942_9PEZI|nr:uncharacterized protein P152DRAFT_456674 [Eremomyces bilateralis CBS 781.70]KAF1814420.1 hypothetical protein P152DRAFT_456674 [Eremomyces bilateralis CBS 781.70]